VNKGRTVSTKRESSGGDGQFRDDAANSPAQGEQIFPSENQAALDGVLRETLDSLSLDKITKPEMDALRDIARRYKNLALNNDPIMIELVRVLLQKRFDFPVGDESEQESISREIAGCLHDTPALRPRLNNFWDRLRDSVQ
jgi:hypothetical protein